MGGKQNIQKERLQINNMLITSLNPNYHSLRTPESFYFFYQLLTLNRKGGVIRIDYIEAIFLPFFVGSWLAWQLFRPF